MKHLKKIKIVITKYHDILLNKIYIDIQEVTDTITDYWMLVYFFFILCHSLHQSFLTHSIEVFCLFGSSKVSRSI